jgi:hypothetical protein
MGRYLAVGCTRSLVPAAPGHSQHTERAAVGLGPAGEYTKAATPTPVTVTSPVEKRR